MKKLILLAAILVVAIGSEAVAASKTVTITRTGFVPERVTIPARDTISWTNSDSVVHQVVFDKASCNLTIQPGQSASCAFKDAGSFNYRDPSQRGSFRGTITVTPSVTAAAARPLVVYGSGVALSGLVSNERAGEPVAVLAQECGKTPFSPLQTVTTAAGGAWSLVVKPTLTTVFEARWKTATSVQTTVKVRPGIRLTRPARGRFVARVSAATSFAGKYLLLQRYDRFRGRWVTVRRGALRAAPSQGPTVVSTRAFTARPKRGLRLRALLPAAQAGPCYAASTSNAVRA